MSLNLSLLKYKLEIFIRRRSFPLLLIFIIIYILIFIVLCLVKYKTFAYNGIDLAIYNQVFYNSSLGDLFRFTIHPHLYLGDHFEPFILILLPFYFILRFPIILLILQTISIGLCAWPIYLITKNKLGVSWALLFSVIFLLNPFIQNANIFEFHLLSFAILFLLFTFYFYQKNNFLLFFIFSFLSLLIREDVSLVILMFGILSLFDKRSIRWIVTPIILGGIWLIISYQLISFFNPDNNYKFFVYYSWLGSTPNEMVKSIVTHPLLIIQHLFTLQNLILIFAFLIPFAFLPIFALRYLIPAVLVALQLFLSGFGDLIFKTHYHSLITPFLFIASVYGFYYLTKSDKSRTFPEYPTVYRDDEEVSNISFQQGLKPRWKVRDKISRLKNYILKQKTIFIIFFVISIIYSSLTLGPLLPMLAKIWSYPAQLDENQLKHEFSAEVSQNFPVVASFQFLPVLSSRTHLYSLHYAFLGKKQYSTEDYYLPEDTQEMLFDFNDFIIYQIQSQNIKIYEEQYSTGDERIRNIIKSGNFGLAKIIDNYALFKKDVSNDIRLYEISQTIDPRIEEFNKDLDGKILFIGWRKLPVDASVNQIDKSSYQILPLSFSWQALTNINENYQLLFELADKNGNVVYRKLYPLAYGLYPTSRWSTDDIVNTNYWFLIPKPLNIIDYNPQFSLVTLNGYMTLDGTGSVVMKLKATDILGEKLK